MNTPIKAGDLAEVIDGLLGKASPNLGLIVRVRSYVGDHSQHGRIWRCEAEYAVRGQEGSNVPTGTADFAQAWLRRIEPPKSGDLKTVEAPVTAKGAA
jgi:hypothetical protein